ncbi:hybrid sensor histidine kinase/response regulator [Lichenibacterium ramalinae]|nr:response regulator [Lichenibacterium ramalinae]
MHKFLRLLSRQDLSPPARYGLPILLVALATLVRLVAPLDVAPFLLYMPVILFVAVAVGPGPGFLGTALSTLFAAGFFARSNGAIGATASVFTMGQAVALLQYVVVGFIMVTVSASLRRAIIENEATLRRLDEANRTLVESRASLLAAKAEAEVARRDAEAAKEAAEGANRAKSAFLANMSHELRTPLSAVIGYSEMLEEQAEDMGEAGMLADLGKVKSNARHLLSLINDVLDLSKIEAAKMESYGEDFDVADFARDAAATVDSLVRRKGNRLVLDLGDGLGPMHSDVVKLRQCLFNLLSNAAKFTENGTITVRVRREASGGVDWVSFAVEDTGIGMAPEQIARLFQRFAQADDSTTRRFGGTGLGLALSRAFSQLLGGDIAVDSIPGQGTTFTLRVPAVLQETVQDASEDANADASGDGEDGALADPTLRPPGVAAADLRLVLVVDDEASQRELLSRFLQRQGFAVRTAADGRSGLDLARALKPHVILLDVMLPEIDGWSVLQALKEDPATALIPVVMVSFVAEAGLSAALGAVDAVPKPVDWVKLRTVMDQFRDGGDVLIVDDDADARGRLRSVLEASGWSVQEAGDGAEALRHVLHTPPHVILLDLTMPVMDGFTFLHRLRETPGCADLPVIVLSARDMSPTERSRLAEADGVLRKGEASLREVAAEVRRLDDRQAGPVAPV